MVLWIFADVGAYLAVNIFPFSLAWFQLFRLTFNCLFFITLAVIIVGVIMFARAENKWKRDLADALWGSTAAPAGEALTGQGAANFEHAPMRRS
jgi:hypothetical protein